MSYRRFPRRFVSNSRPVAVMGDCPNTPKIVRYTWGEMLDVALQPAAGTAPRTSREVGEGSWNGTYTFEQALDLARNGWHAVTDATMERMIPLVEAVGSMMQQEEYFYAVTGNTFDVARLLEGEPECWINQESNIKEGAGKVLRIVFNFTCSASITREVIIAKGAAIAALVTLLERRGIPVQVDTVEYSGHYGQHYQMWVTAKEPGQDLDVPRLMFAMANLAMQRRISWAVHEAVWPIFGGGYYGSVGEVEDTGDLYIGCSMTGDPQWTDHNSARTWVIAQLRQQGIELRESA